MSFSYSLLKLSPKNNQKSPRKPQLNFLWLSKTESIKVGLKVFLWGHDVRTNVIELFVSRSNSKLFRLGGGKKIQGLLEEK